MSDVVVRGLTLWRPWPWAMALDKPIENRPWKPPVWLISNWVALHAGLTFDAEAFDDMKNGLYTEAAKTVPPKAEHPSGVIVAVGRLTGYFEKHTLFVNEKTGGTYAFGPVCWRFPVRHKLERPVPHRGAQGLWKIQPDALAAIMEQVDLETAQ